MRHKLAYLGGIVTVNADDICGLLLLAFEVAGEDILDTIGVSLLGVEGGTGVMSDHGISAVLFLAVELHCSPWVVLRGGLLLPDITTVASDVALVDGISDVLSDANSTTIGRKEATSQCLLGWLVGVHDSLPSSVDDPSALLHPGELLLVDEMLGSLVQRSVDREDIYQKQNSG